MLEDMLGIRPCCLSHDCICPMTIWGFFYQKKPLSPVIDRESRRGTASFRGLELLYLHIFRARFAQPSPRHSQHLRVWGVGGRGATMSCALHATCPTCARASILKGRGKNGRVYDLILSCPVEAPEYDQYEACGCWT